MAALAASLLVLGTAPGAQATVPTWKAWLCKPGQVGYCSSDLSLTEYGPSGAATVVGVPSPSNPPIDCFYVYPTVSEEHRGNADLKIQDPEKAAVIAQAARFSQVCRVFAPVYRQQTVYGGGSSVVAFESVLAAWRDYLAHDNDGRGVVLIGHSAGAFMLEDLLEDRSAGVGRVLVSAILLGGDVQVDSADRFDGFPACRSSSQIGCVIGYSSWSSTPPADAELQSVDSAAQHVLCVNPGDLADHTAAAPITPIFPWVVPEGLVPGVITPEPKTFWVSFPDLYRARCVRDGTRSWLLITRIAHRGDPRPMVQPVLGPTFGLHAADANIALGNLISIVQAEAAAWQHRH